MLDELQNEWAPLTDPVFQLTPTAFHAPASFHYESMGGPAISSGTFWDIYSALLGRFRARPEPERHSFDNAFRLANLAAGEVMELMQGVRELRNGDRVVGDHAFIENYAAVFTDDEDEDGEFEAEFTDED